MLCWTGSFKVRFSHFELSYVTTHVMSVSEITFLPAECFGYTQEPDRHFCDSADHILDLILTFYMPISH